MNPRWVATLSDGTTAYADDYRPGEAASTSWRRLKVHCEDNGLHVVDLWLQFRSHRVHIEPPSADGYYLAYTVGALVGEGTVRHGYLAGTLTGDMLTIVHYSLPELQPIGGGTRTPDLASPSLILRDGGGKNPVDGG